MSIDFNAVIERRGTGSTKWAMYPDDVLPMWVADMDFPSPPAVVQALQERAAHGFFGYEFQAPRLLEVLCERMERLYDWKVLPEHFILLPSLVSGINVVYRAIGEADDHILTTTPIYPPFLASAPNHQKICNSYELPLKREGQRLSYGLDLEQLEATFTERTRLFMLCNPQNPVGQMYDREMLSQIAEICMRHDALICSDEIHCDLILSDKRHVPMASISPEIADRTITLMAPSKTFNLPGLGCGFAIVPNAELRARITKAAYMLVPHSNAMGLTAALAAYSQCQPWLDGLLNYLKANRDYYVNFINERLPQLATTAPEATYLGWIDCREAGIEGSPYKFFLEEAKVALSDGAMFGKGGEGFVRLNFATPRELLTEGLERMRSALEGVSG
jgi:cysteine-S-conjugate beta-lyase